MLWLDSVYPTDLSSSTPGAARGTCDISSGRPTDVENNHPDAHVVFSNIKVGPIGSTYGSGSGTSPGGPTTTPSGPTTTSPGGSGSTGTAQHWGQCGGNGLDWTNYMR